MKRVMKEVLRPLAVLACAAAGLASPRAPLAAADVHAVRVSEPRAFGHFLGDVLTRRIEIVTDAGDTLAAASLPRPGPLAYWLDLVSVRLGETPGFARRTHRLTLTYQTFYAPLAPMRLVLPSLQISFASGGRTFAASVPSFAFLASPLREIRPASGGLNGEGLLRPDADIRFADTRPAGLLLAVSLSVTAAALGLLAWRFAVWPFHARSGRPFARAAREARAAARAANMGEGYRTALLALHRAFDAAHGHAMLADDLPALLRQRPALAAEVQGIARFFEVSQQVFFGAGANGAGGREGGPPMDLPMAELVRLSARLAVIERG